MVPAMDPETALVLFGSAQLAVRVLGPTADYLGEGIKTWTQDRVRNVRNIFENAAEKLGSELDEEGAVPPRVLAGILTDGSYCDDPVATDYLGGVLASSRTGFKRDDRAASLVALISRMSTYEIRAHYVLYTAARQRLRGQSIYLRMPEQRRFAGRIFVPWSVYDPAMDFTSGEPANAITVHVMYGLSQEDLIGSEWVMGDVEALTSVSRFPTPGEGLVFEVTVPGMELYLWAQGRTDVDTNDGFLDPAEEFRLQPPVIVPEGSLSIPELAPQPEGDGGEPPG
jgi:hypothetical protein